MRPTHTLVATRVGTVLGVAALVACGHAAGTGGAGAPGAGVTQLEMEPVKIEATRGPGGVQIEAFDAADLFEQAGKAHNEGRLDAAVTAYTKLLMSFPASTYAKAALYNRALVQQDRKDWVAAATDFSAFLDKYPEGADAKDALFQLGATYAEAARWTDSRDLFTRALERTDLNADDHVEALARKGFALLNLNDLDNADAVFRQALVFAHQNEANHEERLQTDYYLAFSQYQLGRISHVRSTASPLRWPEARMNQDLEEKARLLLLARRQYIDAVRYGNPRIASMAAFQIGTLFQEFYDALVSVPPPKELEGDEKKEQREVYEDELRKKLRIVLEKALRGHEHNIELFERLGVETEWVTKSRDAIAKLKDLLDPATKFNFADPNAPHPAPGPAVDPRAPDAPTPRPHDNQERPADPSANVPRRVL